MCLILINQEQSDCYWFIPFIITLLSDLWLFFSLHLSIYAFGQPSITSKIAFTHDSHLRACSQFSRGSVCVLEVAQFVSLADDVKSLCARGPSHVIANATRQFRWPFQRNAARWGEVKEHTLELSNCLRLLFSNFSHAHYRVLHNGYGYLFPIKCHWDSDPPKNYNYFYWK